MVDIDAAVGYVVARGDAVERARLSRLRTGASPSSEILASAEAGQAKTGGWPALGDVDVASIDATCFRLAELDELDGLRRPAAARALDWLANRQRLDGCWEEDRALADTAPPWARPGDPEARFYLTANAAYWFAVASADAVASAAAASAAAASAAAASAAVASAAVASANAVASTDSAAYSGAGTNVYEVPLTRAGRAIVDSMDETGAWPGFLISGWLAGAVLHRTEWYYESARTFMLLNERVKRMSAGDTAGMVVALRRAGVAADSLLVAAREHLESLQRPDGAWSSDEPNQDVHTTLTALRALLR
jgi:hypothetical protein